MCTVTLVPACEGLRIACNRDERRDRPAALPPSIHRLRRRSAIYPVDPLGGGTWIGVNDAGVVAALLNHTPEHPPRGAPPPRRSRGVIVTSLLDCASSEEALARAGTIDPRDYALFRLLVVSAERAWILTSDGARVSCEPVDVARPLILTSSSLGDHVVCARRARLFHAFMNAHPGERLAAQERFHDHRWPLRPEISVCMSRDDARTVSRTFVTLTSHGARLSYTELPGESRSVTTFRRAA